MSKYTAEQVQKVADTFPAPYDYRPMLRELARRLRQEEEENRRDPVTDPRPGDRMEAGPFTYLWTGDAKTDVTGKMWMWKTWASEMSNTIIRRREVQ